MMINGLSKGPFYVKKDDNGQQNQDRAFNVYINLHMYPKNCGRRPSLESQIFDSSRTYYKYL